MSETTMTWRCDECQVPEHDTCPLVADCHCCAETLWEMAEEGMGTVKGWLVVAAIVGGLTLWGWAGHLPVYPSTSAPPAAVQVAPSAPAVASPAASSGHHPLQAVRAAHRVVRVHRALRWVRWLRHPRLLPWWLR